jgi:hypothetical protein
MISLMRSKLKDSFLLITAPESWILSKAHEALLGASE